MHKRLVDEINREIAAEFYSGLLYIRMAKDCVYPGAIHWLQLQAKEELGHALKFWDYMRKTGMPIHFKYVEPTPHWDDLKSIFKSVLEHETKVTKNINNLFKLALLYGDKETQNFLQWFVYEQGREMKGAGEIVDKLEADDWEKIMPSLDKELAARKEEKN